MNTFTVAIGWVSGWFLRDPKNSRFAVCPQHLMPSAVMLRTCDQCCTAPFLLGHCVSHHPGSGLCCGCSHVALLNGAGLFQYPLQSEEFVFYTAL